MKLSTRLGLWGQDLTATARSTYRRRYFEILGNCSPRLHSAVASRGKVVQQFWKDRLAWEKAKR